MAAPLLRWWASLPGVVLVAIGAGLWGTDALFRRGLALELPAATVVFWEHLIIVVIMMPFVRRFFRNRPALDLRDLIALLVVGVGASAVATMLFTQAFTYGDPTTPLLLQKVQPVIAVFGAYLLLGERLLPRYGRFFFLAVGSAYLISFSNPTNVSVNEVAPALLAIGAAALWGLGTVLGRHLTAKIEPSQLAALRFTIGLPASAVVVIWQGQTSAVAGIGIADFGTLLALALVPGLAALAVYYRGLAGTPASTATLAELAFPLTAILIGWSIFDTVPSGSQWIGIAVLAFTLVLMSRTAHKAPDALGVQVPAGALIMHQVPDSEQEVV
ncbi:MAG: DMT family transporter [Acidimicrobiia bacterium]